MAIDLRGVTTVLMAGTGSDDTYAYRAFCRPLGDLGAVLVTPAPQPGRLIDGYRQACDDAARAGPIAVGGISVGAAIAVAWALANADRTVGVLAALPAWTGSPDGSPAQLAARHSAALLRSVGLTSATAQMRESSPAWLADELSRSWAGQWPDLPGAMEEAASYRAPTGAQLAGLAMPMGVAAASDDAVHPIEIGREWVAAAPMAALRTLTLSDIGADPTALGVACVDALIEAGAAAGSAAGDGA